MNKNSPEKIAKLTLHSNQGFLTVTDVLDESISLTFEYLRIFSPTESKKVQSSKSTSTSPQVFHKKQIKISTIDLLGKHGYRFIFNDGFTDVFSDADLINLYQQYDDSWATYEASLSSINSREENINFKAVT